MYVLLLTYLVHCDTQRMRRSWSSSRPDLPNDEGGRRRHRLQRRKGPVLDGELPHSEKLKSSTLETNHSWMVHAGNRRPTPGYHPQLPLRRAITRHVDLRCRVWHFV